MADPKGEVERLKACAESMACNAANLRADTLPGEANADFYIRTADEQEQWSADLRALIASHDKLVEAISWIGKPHDIRWRTAAEAYYWANQFRLANDTVQQALAAFQSRQENNT